MTAAGALGTIHTTRWATGHANSLLLRIFGDKGGIVVYLDRSYNEIQVCRGKDIDACVKSNATGRAVKV